MNIKVQTDISASKESIWKVITDIENAPNNIKGIEKVEIIEKPDSGIVGLKWKETRTLFGKSATEVMWITDAKENEYYHTRAENHGMIYKTKVAIESKGDKNSLSMDFSGETQGMMAKFLAEFMGPIFKGATKKAIQRDLEDIKKKVENN